MTARQSASARAKPNERTASSRRSASVSPQTTSSASNSRSGNSVGMRSSERLWACPSQPKPITPTPMRRRARPVVAGAPVVSMALIGRPRAGESPPGRLLPAKRARRARLRRLRRSSGHRDVLERGPDRAGRRRALELGLGREDEAVAQDGGGHAGDVVGGDVGAAGEPGGGLGGGEQVHGGAG